MQQVHAREIWDLVYRTTRRAGFAVTVAEVLADATTEAELQGKSNVGLEHLFYYFQAVKNRLISATPKAVLTPLTATMLVVDADHGPMQFAYREAEPTLIQAAKAQGLGLLTIRNAFAGGELGYYARRLAREGLVSMAFANSPAVMSVGGSYDRLLGTNPLSYGIPLGHGRAVIIDQASSSTARVNFQRYATRREPIPDNWALDRHGQPTTDPQAALEGTLLPFGGYKGGNIALLVEFMAMLGGGDSSVEAAPYYAGDRRQGIGATVIAIDTEKFVGYRERIEALVEQFRRDHGSKIRIADLQPVDRNVEVRASLWSQLNHYAERGVVEEG